MPPYTGDPKQHDPSKFATSLSATCLCGSIHVTITDNELFTKPRGHLCHCANCRKVAGSYVASNLLIEEDKVKIVDAKGSLKKYADFETGSGRPVNRWFCGECGNPIYSQTDNFLGKLILKMGMFPRIPQPEAESFADHRQSWQGKHDGVDQYKIKLFGERFEG